MVNLLKEAFFEAANLSPDNQKLIERMINEDKPHQSEELDSYLENLKKMSSTTKKFVGNFAKGLLLDTKTGRYIIHAEDCGIGGHLRANGEYRSRELHILKQFVHADSKVLLVGAHIGTSAIPLSKVCSSLACIEVNPETFELLTINIGINRAKNCKAYNLAANDKYENLTFINSKVNSGSCKRKPLIDHYWYNYDQPSTFEMSSGPLDDAFADEHFNVIIICIEGSEYFALKGMTKLLEKAGVLILEFVPHHLKNVSSVSVKDLFALLPKYESMTVPSLNMMVAYEHMLSLLEFMYENNLTEENLIFQMNQH